jgi:hypothetical protein
MNTWIRNKEGKFILDRSGDTVYNTNDYYIKLRFKPIQLDILKYLYHTEIAPHVTNFTYLGQAVTIDWSTNNNLPNVERKYDAADTITGLKIPRLINHPIWKEHFSDILPYMNQDASLSILPPYSVMAPHIDRPYRPVPIYFPISGCTNNCFSDIYDLPLYQEKKVRTFTWEVIPPVLSYNIIDDPVMMCNSTWHGVRNFSRQTRIAFGWNTKGDTDFKTFSELKEIFKNLGYCNE